MVVVWQEEKNEERSGAANRSSRRGAAAAREGSDKMKRCGMWLPAKRRFCSSYARADCLYCGNHDPSAREKRVPCPVDPSHTVLQQEVALHVRRCQATKYIKLTEEQPYYCKGVNAGSDGEEEEEFGRTRGKLNGENASSITYGLTVENGASNELNPTDCHSEKWSVASPDAPERKGKGVRFQSSAAKRAAITALSEAEFLNLVRRIESSHETCISGETVEEFFLQPPQCSQWWDANRDRRLPFQEKHVSQQASMLGNLEAFGLLESEETTGEVPNFEGPRQSRAYVEFGAGRGYLSQMLCDSYGVSSVVLIERKAYKYKADRTLRQLTGVSVERLRTDIEDLNVNGVQSLQGRRYVAVGKHLCGPATDMTLRCCLNGMDHPSHKLSGPEGHDSLPTLEGIGIATCCHHLCQWRSYVNKQFFRKLGFAEAEFHMITWLTSWAVSENGEHCEVERSEVAKVVEQKAACEASCLSTDSAGPRLSEVMDAMDVGSRAELGRKCKYLIDVGRLLLARRYGLESKIVKYISASVSPENKLLLARKNIM